jgi:hypothetical protein
VNERLEAVLRALRGGPLTAFEIVPQVYGEALGGHNAHWLLSKVLCYLTHLRGQQLARSIAGEPERWIA